MACVLSVLDWQPSPVTKYFFIIILFDNPIKYNQKYHDYEGWSLVTNLYSHNIILVLFLLIIERDCKKKYLVTGDRSQFISAMVCLLLVSLVSNVL